MSSITQNQTNKHIAKDSPYKMGFYDQSEEHNRRIQKRTDSFELLSDTDGMAKRLSKTKICHNLEKYGKCTRNVCTFAHSMGELNDPECVFDAKGGCRKKNCMFKHDKETSEGYRQRCGIRFPDKKDEMYSDHVREVLNAGGSKGTNPDLEQETILRVPLAMAREAFELAIAQGRCNIRVEIV